MPVSLFPRLSQALRSINHSFWQAESKDTYSKSQLEWNWTKKKNNFIGHLTQNMKEQSHTRGGNIDREPQRGVESSGACEYGSVHPWFGGADVGVMWRWRLQVQTHGSCATMLFEGYEKVASFVDASSQNNLDFMLKWHRLHAIKSFCFTWEVALKTSQFWKGLEYLKDVNCERWIFFVWFSLSKFPPTWKGTLPLY